MVWEAAWSHSKGGDLLWRKLQLGCLLGAEVCYFLDHFFLEVRRQGWVSGGGRVAGEEGFWTTVGYDLCQQIRRRHCLAFFVCRSLSAIYDTLRHLHDGTRQKN